MQYISLWIPSTVWGGGCDLKPLWETVGARDHYEKLLENNAFLWFSYLWITTPMSSIFVVNNHHFIIFYPNVMLTIPISSIVEVKQSQFDQFPSQSAAQPATSSPTSFSQNRAGSQSSANWSIWPLLVNLRWEMVALNHFFLNISLEGNNFGGAQKQDIWPGTQYTI